MVNKRMTPPAKPPAPMPDPPVDKTSKKLSSSKIEAKAVSKAVQKGERPQNKHLKPWPKGKSGNPKGMKVGTKQWMTLYREAVDLYAKTNKMTPQQVEVALMSNRIKHALRGDHRFDRRLEDRVHGPIPKEIDHKSGGEPLKQINYIIPQLAESDGDDTEANTEAE